MKLFNIVISIMLVFPASLTANDEPLQPLAAFAVPIILSAPIIAFVLLIKSFYNYVSTKPLVPVSQETKEKIDPIIKEMGVDPEKITLLNDGNDMSYEATCGNVIRLNEKDALTMSPEELRFIIGHEVTHLKHDFKLIYPKMIGSLLVPLAGIIGLSTLLSRNGVSIPTALNPLVAKNTFLAFGLSIMLGNHLTRAYSRSCEYRADRETVEILRCHDGAIKWLKKYLGTKYDVQESSSTHPTFKQRIEEIEKLKRTIQPRKAFQSPIPYDF